MTTVQPIYDDAGNKSALRASDYCRSDGPDEVMKTFWLCLLAFAIAASGSAARAQTVVNITATDSAAAETWPGQAPNSANIRITRTGSTASALAVWVKVSGTAIRNLDYSFRVPVGAFVTIPAMS